MNRLRNLIDRRRRRRDQQLAEAIAKAFTHVPLVAQVRGDDLVLAIRRNQQKRGKGPIQ